MKLLIVTQRIDEKSPASSFFLDWIIEFAKKCDLVTIICLKKGNHSLPGRIKILSLGKENGVFKLKYICNFYKYIWQERKNYDKVFIHMNPEYVILGGLLWRMWRKKISLWYTHKNVDVKLRLAEFLTHKIFSASEKSFRLKSNKVIITGHGINLKKFQPARVSRKKDDVFNIVSVGRIAPIKDYETLFEAINLISQQKVKVTIIGGTHLEKDQKYLIKLIELMRGKKIRNKIDFIGPVPIDGVIQYYQSADLFVNMSHTGSLDKSILEAMACKTRVITCNEALVRILTTYREQCYFSKKNYTELAKKIMNMINMPQSESEILKSHLQRKVLKEHNLKNLIKKIIHSL